MRKPPCHPARVEIARRFGGMWAADEQGAVFAPQSRHAVRPEVEQTRQVAQGQGIEEGDDVSDTGIAAVVQSAPHGYEPVRPNDADRYFSYHRAGRLEGDLPDQIR